MKHFKIVRSHILDAAVHKPKFVELLTYVGSAVRIVSERPLVPLNDDPRDFTAITPASLLTSYLEPHVAVGQPHDRGMLRRDYRFNLSLPAILRKVDSLLFTLAAGAEKVVEGI